MGQLHLVIEPDQRLRVADIYNKKHPLTSDHTAGRPGPRTASAASPVWPRAPANAASPMRLLAEPGRLRRAGGAPLNSPEPSERATRVRAKLTPGPGRCRGWVRSW